MKTNGLSGPVSGAALLLVASTFVAWYVSAATDTPPVSGRPTPEIASSDVKAEPPKELPPPVAVPVRRDVKVALEIDASCTTCHASTVAWKYPGAKSAFHQPAMAGDRPGGARFALVDTGGAPVAGAGGGPPARQPNAVSAKITESTAAARPSRAEQIFRETELKVAVRHYEGTVAEIAEIEKQLAQLVPIKPVNAGDGSGPVKDARASERQALTVKLKALQEWKKRMEDRITVLTAASNPVSDIPAGSEPAERKSRNAENAARDNAARDELRVAHVQRQEAMAVAAEAEARLQALELNLQKLQANAATAKPAPADPTAITVARAELEMAKTEFELAQKSHLRVQKLATSNLVGTTELDEAKAGVDLKSAKVRIAEAKLVQAEKGGAVSFTSSAEALDARDADVLRAELDLAKTEAQSAQVSRQRIEALRVEKTISQSEVDDAVAADERARARLRIAEARLARALSAAPKAGTGPIGIGSNSVPPPNNERSMKLLEDEIKAAEEQAVLARKQYESGLVNVEECLRAETDVLNLRRELARRLGKTDEAKKLIREQIRALEMMESAAREREKQGLGTGAEVLKVHQQILSLQRQEADLPVTPTPQR